MTKTVCDICGCDNAKYRCAVPMYKQYNMEQLGIKVGEYKKIETIQVDLCSEHYIMLADFIETMKENTHVL